MNAYQFIQKHGIEKARQVVEGAPDGATHLSNDTRHYVNADFKPLPDHIKEQLPELIVIDDLKRLVESVDLVNKLGGIVIAREKLTYGNSISAMRLSYETTITGRDGTKQNVITGVYLEDLKQAIADYESAYSNDMGNDTHIENHISPLCKTESQPVLIVEMDNQIIERLKAENVVLQAKVDELQVENKILNQAASTHLKNQMHFKKLYDALVEQLYPYAIDLEDHVDGDVNTPKEYVDGYNRARECAHYNLLEMMESDVEYIKAQCGMLGGGGEVMKSEFENSIKRSSSYEKLVYQHGERLFIFDDGKYKIAAVQLAWEIFKEKQTEVDELTLQVAEMKSRLNDAYTAGQSAMYTARQSKVDELQKQRDSFIKAYEIEMDESVELQKRVDAAFRVLSQLNDLDDEAHKRWKREACMFSQGESNAYEHSVRLLEQALKGDQ